MFYQVTRTIAIGILAGAALFFVPFIFHILLFFLIAGFFFRLFSGYRYRGYRRGYGRWRPDFRDEMTGSFLNTHYHHKSGITPLYQRPEGSGPENEIRIH